MRSLSRKSRFCNDHRLSSESRILTAPPPLLQGKVKAYKGSKFLFMRHGNGTAEHLDGLIFEGRWTFGLWNGEGIVTWPEKWVYRGRFKNGMLHGKGVLALENGVAFEGRFRKSVPTGKGIVKFTDGSRFEGRWLGPDAAKGKYFDAENKLSKALIENGALTTKNGFFSKKTTRAYFSFRQILAGNVT